LAGDREEWREPLPMPDSSVFWYSDSSVDFVSIAALRVLLVVEFMRSKESFFADIVNSLIGVIF